MTLDSVHVSLSLAAALDPVLTRVGFSPAQAGLLWCINYQELQTTHPWLPQAEGQDEHGRHACVDLIVTVDDGVVTDLHFEYLTLADTFSALGRQDEAEAAARLVGAPVEVATPELARLLTGLFERR